MNAQLEIAPTAEAAQAAITDEFAFFGDWTERYQYLIDLGRKLPPFPDALKSDEHKVTGCQSLVWLVPSGDAKRLEFQAISDSAIVSGLIALLMRVYSGRSAQEILATEPKFIEAIGLAKHLSGAKLDAAYEYINWYTSGWVGAYLNRQGYYSAAMETAKEHMSADEWGYWVEGKPAQGDIIAPDGKVMEKAGAVRDGGSFEERMGKVACWNSVMDEDRYMVRRWNEFIAA